MPAYNRRQSTPTTQDADLARACGQRLSKHVRRKKPLTLKVTEAGQDQDIELPASAVRLLMEILEAMAAGRGVTIIPQNAELTTVQAASVLNVSRPFLIQLLENGKLPHRKVGKHRRILIDDVLAYKDKIDRAREVVLDELAADAQENDMGYART